MSDLANIVLMRANPSQSQALGAALTELVGLTQQEAGCIVCELNRSAGDPDLWMVYERWRGQAAFASHMEQPYVARFLARLGELVSGAPDVQAFEFRG